jgi:hypothetical protein
MAQNFLACDREQPFLLPPDVREWLPEDHLAWFVIDAVGVMDTSCFYAAYREDGHGRAAYEPSMLIALLLYCWARGVRSSRASSGRALRMSRAVLSLPTSDRITPRSRASSSVTRGRWASCLARCWCCARTPAWRRSG